MSEGLSPRTTGSSFEHRTRGPWRKITSVRGPLEKSCTYHLHSRRAVEWYLYCTHNTPVRWTRRSSPLRRRTLRGCTRGRYTLVTASHVRCLISVARLSFTFEAAFIVFDLRKASEKKHICNHRARAKTHLLDLELHVSIDDGLSRIFHVLVHSCR